jgi:hypothetical protein
VDVQVFAGEDGDAGEATEKEAMEGDESGGWSDVKEGGIVVPLKQKADGDGLVGAPGKSTGDGDEEAPPRRWWLAGGPIPTRLVVLGRRSLSREGTKRMTDFL